MTGRTQWRDDLKQNYCAFVSGPSALIYQLKTRNSYATFDRASSGEAEGVVAATLPICASTSPSSHDREVSGLS